MEMSKKIRDHVAVAITIQLWTRMPGFIETKKMPDQQQLNEMVDAILSAVEDA